MIGAQRGRAADTVARAAAAAASAVAEAAFAPREFYEIVGQSGPGSNPGAGHFRLLVDTYPASNNLVMMDENGIEWPVAPLHA